MSKPSAPETILQSALEIEAADERAAYLDRACGDDGALRDDLELLIAAHLEADAFLEPVKDSILDGIQRERSGDKIGRYLLVEPLGEGGFGTVYLAEQSEPVKRRVALKVIKPGMDSREVIARFEAERQALAMMDHPHIAKVHDAGTTDSGLPYFVMEWVDGVPVTDYCASTSPGLRARLRLFIDVCAAIQHAHQKGMIHRDLKPSNLLVSTASGQPVVKVIDFGIAKAIGVQLTEKTIHTQQGLMIGTPQYMSPEQATGNVVDVDTRSDIYSLGVILFELLTGTTPLDGRQLRSASYADVQQLIRDKVPPKPSTRLGERMGQQMTGAGVTPRSLRGDLDWIILKALEKEPSRRYESAGALADDLGRYLEHQPVSARPPSVTYAMRQFARRNRVVVLAAIGLLLALMLGTVGTSLGMKRALDAQQVLAEQNAVLDEQKMELEDIRKRLSDRLQSNQEMLEQIQRMKANEEKLPRQIDAMRRDNQALLDQVHEEVADQKRAGEQLRQTKADLEKQLEQQQQVYALLKRAYEQLETRQGGLEAQLDLLGRRPSGTYQGLVTFHHPGVNGRWLKSQRRLEFAAGGRVMLNCMDQYWDSEGQPEGAPRKSVIELTGSWDGSVFRSKQQRVETSDYPAWADEDIHLSYSVQNNRIEWLSTFASSGKIVVGRGVLAADSE